MPQKETVSVRGANGLNLYVTASEPSDAADLVSCQNIDLSVRRAVLPRLGFGRPSAWSGLVSTAGGKIISNDFGTGIAAEILTLCAAGGLFVTAPSVAS